jgi:hypothetical protein
VLAVRLRVFPVHNGELLDAVGGAGIGWITTFAVALLLVHPFTVTFTVYVPALESVTFGIVLFCVDEEKADGPLHEYVAPTTLLAFSVRLSPTHNGEFVVIVGGAGVGFTTTVVVAADELEHPPTFTVTE